MKLSCIDQSVADGDCYVLCVADVSASIVELIVSLTTSVLLVVESDALWFSASSEQLAEIPASILRFCGRLGRVEA